VVRGDAPACHFGEEGVKREERKRGLELAQSKVRKKGSEEE